MFITIEAETLRRIKGFTHLAPGEVTGMARVKTVKGELFVYDLQLLPEQRVTAGSAELDNEQLALFLCEQENAEEFKFLWHSHVRMAASLSTIDETCIKGILITSPYLISCVSNKNGDMHLQFDAMIDGVRISQTAKLSEETIIDYSDLETELNSHIIRIMPPVIYGYNGNFPKLKNAYLSKKDIRNLMIAESLEHPFDCDCRMCNVRRKAPNNLSLLENGEVWDDNWGQTF
jgi:proteasome lid subunit RPN8/RPN11